MRFFTTVVLSALAAIAAAADKPNAFSVPVGGFLLKAGEPTTFKWTDLEGDTVTLQLRDGANGNLNAGTTIASNIKNTGSFTWNVPATTVEGATYAVEIINDEDKSETNFTPQFVIQSPIKAVSTSSGASSASTTGTASSTGSSSSATGTTLSTSASASASTTGSSSASRTASATTSATSSGSSTVPTTNAGNAIKAGGSLLAVAFGFAVAM